MHHTHTYTHIHINRNDSTAPKANYKLCIRSMSYKQTPKLTVYIKNSPLPRRHLLPHHSLPSSISSACTQNARAVLLDPQRTTSEYHTAKHPSSTIYTSLALFFHPSSPPPHRTLHIVHSIFASYTHL